MLRVCPASKMGMLKICWQKKGKGQKQLKALVSLGDPLGNTTQSIFILWR